MGAAWDSGAIVLFAALVILAAVLIVDLRRR